MTTAGREVNPGFLVVSTGKDGHDGLTPALAVPAERPALPPERAAMTACRPLGRLPCTRTDPHAGQDGSGRGCVYDAGDVPDHKHDDQTDEE